jgi:hypothetical protein
MLPAVLLVRSLIELAKSAADDVGAPSRLLS